MPWSRYLRSVRILLATSVVLTPGTCDGSLSHRRKGHPMKTIVVRYKTSEAHAEANAALVRAVFNELRSRTPKGLRYATYREADKVTFVHIATVDSVGDNPLVNLPAFKAFQRELKERCVDLPVVTELSAVDSYDALS